MTQRTALAIATGITAFVLVFIAGFALYMAQSRPTIAATISPTQDTISQVAPAADPSATVQALVAQREEAYKQALDQANQQLQQAKSQLEQANAQLQAAYNSKQASTAAPVAAPTDAPVPPAPTEAPAPVQDQQPAYAISPRQAARIAQSVAPGATLLQLPGLVDFQGSTAYEVRLDQGMVYIDANTGQVLYNGAATAVVPPARNGDDDGGGGDD